jgi:hypothetical protein
VPHEASDDKAGGDGKNAGDRDRLAGLPLGMPRSAAIGVSRLTGMNSDEMSTATQSAIEKTAPHAACGFTSRSS